MDIKNWEVMPGGNLICEGEGFYVSFKRDLSKFGSFFDSDNGQPETALVKGEKFFILNGDWRYQYEDLVPKGWKACKAFFDANSETKKSSWSN